MLEGKIINKPIARRLAAQVLMILKDLTANKLCPSCVSMLLCRIDCAQKDEWLSLRFFFFFLVFDYTLLLRNLCFESWSPVL